jgi:hypothetical protein
MSKKSKNKPAVKSKTKKVPTLDWTPSSKNANTLRKIEEAINKEKEIQDGSL